MSNHDEYLDRLSDYLDDELSAGERRDVDAHLTACAGCRRALLDLQEVIDRAHALAPREPDGDLWPGIAARIPAVEASRSGTRWYRRGSLPQLAAAAVLLLAAAWGFVSVLDAPQPAPPPAADAVVATPADRVVQARLDDTEYDTAVSDLRAALDKGRASLDPATVKVIEDNLAIIDRAVEEARRALDADPANDDLSGYLVETRRRQIALLRRAATLATEMN